MKKIIFAQSILLLILSLMISADIYSQNVEKSHFDGNIKEANELNEVIWGMAHCLACKHPDMVFRFNGFDYDDVDDDDEKENLGKFVDADCVWSGSSRSAPNIMDINRLFDEILSQIRDSKIAIDRIEDAVSVVEISPNWRRKLEYDNSSRTLRIGLTKNILPLSGVYNSQFDRLAIPLPGIESPISEVADKIASSLSKDNNKTQNEPIVSVEGNGQLVEFSFSVPAQYLEDAILALHYDSAYDNACGCYASQNAKNTFVRPLPTGKFEIMIFAKVKFMGPVQAVSRRIVNYLESKLSFAFKELNVRVKYHGSENLTDLSDIEYLTFLNYPWTFATGNIDSACSIATLRFRRIYGSGSLPAVLNMTNAEKSTYNIFRVNPYVISTGGFAPMSEELWEVKTLVDNSGNNENLEKQLFSNLHDLGVVFNSIWPKYREAPVSIR